MKKILLALALVAIFSSCSALRFTSIPGETFPKSVPLTITPYHDDTNDGASELLYLLQHNNYNLIAFETAQATIGYDFRSGSSKESGSHINVYDTIYILDINCKADPMNPAKYASYRATVSDLKTGKIILSATMRGQLNAEQVSRRLVNRMNQSFK